MGEARVEKSVRNLIGELVGMSFAHGFGGVNSHLFNQAFYLQQGMLYFDKQVGGVWASIIRGVALPRENEPNGRFSVSISCIAHR